MERKLDILQGTLDLMVLRTLTTLGRQHGYAIAGRLEQISQGSLQLNMGTLYPALVRLEQRGLSRVFAELQAMNAEPPREDGDQAPELPAKPMFG